jgi:hypothetical protein
VVILEFAGRSGRPHEFKEGHEEVEESKREFAVRIDRLPVRVYNRGSTESPVPQTDEQR